MRILCVNQFFTPDRVATAQVLSDLCEYLATEGHQVSVLCSRRRYDEGDSRFAALPRRERVGRVDVARVGGTGFGKRSRVGQLSDFLSFHLLGGLRLLVSAHRYDLIVTLTTPPLIGVWGAIAKAVFKVPHVYWVMNLHPDVEFELGVLNRHKPLSRLLDALSTASMKRADACVALGECMSRRLRAKGVAASRVRVIPLWGHTFSGRSAGAVDRLCHRWGLAGKFVVMYSGNAGTEYMFEELCEAARQLRDDPRFIFLFIGGGQRTAEIDAYRRTHQLSTMRLMGYLAREELEESLEVADVHFVCLRPELAGVSVPCKLYGAMSASRPVIFIGPDECETSDVIRRSGCGRVLARHDVPGLVGALRELADQPDLRDSFGRAGRNSFEAFYHFGRGCRDLCRLFEEVVAARQQVPAAKVSDQALQGRGAKRPSPVAATRSPQERVH